MTRHHRIAGFTLIELLFALAVVAILLGLALPQYRDYLDRARSAAFLTQLDAWREKAATESVANGADLCHWDEHRFGAMREVIFSQATLQPATFGSYSFALTPRAVSAATPAGPTDQPFVVDVVATASDGPQALNVARLLRIEVERAGLRHVSPGTDRDLPSMQSFSVLLGSCPAAASGSGGGSGPVVAGIVRPGEPSHPGGGTVPPRPADSASSAAGSVPASGVPARAPGVAGSAPDLPASAGVPARSGASASAPSTTAAPSAPNAKPGGGPGPAQTVPPAAGGTVHPPLACTGGRQPSADGQRCECRVGNWNAHQHRCVGNNRNH